MAWLPASETKPSNGKPIGSSKPQCHSGDTRTQTPGSHSRPISWEPGRQSRKGISNFLPGESRQPELTRAPGPHYKSIESRMSMTQTADTIQNPNGKKDKGGPPMPERTATAPSTHPCPAARTGGARRGHWAVPRCPSRGPARTSCTGPEHSSVRLSPLWKQSFWRKGVN